MSRNCVLIIPSLNPDGNLIPYVERLVSNGFSKIIMIDDGSGSESKHIFDTLKSMPECDLLVHTVNMGKGRSLKDALNYYCQVYAGRYRGVLTLDADGQHTVEDAICLDSALREYPQALILGTRDFDGQNVPARSSFGNKMTRHVMRMVIGSACHADADGRSKVISDTQTGMRAIPNQLIEEYLTLFGERFEYETNMLIEALRQKTPIKEIHIQTVYINGNSESHFRPLADSFAIYRLIFSTFFKYTLASLSSYFVDYSIYSLFIFMLAFLPLGPRVWIGAAFARILSSLYNYAMNMSVVFKDNGNHGKTLAKYYTLCALQLCCSALSVCLICQYTGFSEIHVKLAVDIVLFMASFYIQKNWVFQNLEKKGHRNVSYLKFREG